VSHIEADHGLCEGIGMCETTADTYFQVGDDGFVQVLQDSPAAGDEKLVKSAVEACPVFALKLLG
jgi:ferredoxin